MLSARDPLEPRPQPILVAGVSGSGKTTLARAIAARTGNPHTEIDALRHGPDWTRTRNGWREHVAGAALEHPELRIVRLRHRRDVDAWLKRLDSA